MLSENSPFDIRWTAGTEIDDEVQYLSLIKRCFFRREAGAERDDDETNAANRKPEPQEISFHLFLLPGIRC
jgi:hypothetical protein